MRFPWISRQAYDDMKALYERQIARLEEENRRFWHHMTGQTDLPVVEPIAATPEQETAPEPATAIDKLVQMAGGKRSARAITQAVTQKLGRDSWVKSATAAQLELDQIAKDAKAKARSVVEDAVARSDQAAKEQVTA